MLETEIKNLTEAVKALTEALTSQKTQAAPVPSAAPADEKPKVAKPKVAKPKTKEADAPKKETSEAEPTASDIQSLCMRIVQADRSKADAIREVLSNHGATSVTRLAAEHYGSVMAALSAIEKEA